MQFLVIEKSPTDVPTDEASYRQVPAILRATKDYANELSKRGKLKAVWGFSDVPGAAYVVDVASPEELTQILTAAPTSMLPHTREVHPISPLASSIDTTASTIEASFAQMDAMRRQR